MKKDWENNISLKIDNMVEKISKEKIQIMIKLQDQQHQRFELQNYIKQNSFNQVCDVMKTKLEMWDVGNNIGNGCRICFACKEMNERKQRNTYANVIRLMKS